MRKETIPADEPPLIPDSELDYAKGVVIREESIPPDVLALLEWWDRMRENGCLY